MTRSVQGPRQRVRDVHAVPSSPLGARRSESNAWRAVVSGEDGVLVLLVLPGRQQVVELDLGPGELRVSLGRAAEMQVQLSEFHQVVDVRRAVDGLFPARQSGLEVAA